MEARYWLPSAWEKRQLLLAVAAIRPNAPKAKLRAAVNAALPRRSAAMECAATRGKPIVAGYAVLPARPTATENVAAESAAIKSAAHPARLAATTSAATRDKPTAMEHVVTARAATTSVAPKARVVAAISAADVIRLAATTSVAAPAKTVAGRPAARVPAATENAAPKTRCVAKASAWTRPYRIRVSAELEVNWGLRGTRPKPTARD